MKVQVQHNSTYLTWSTAEHERLDIIVVFKGENGKIICSGIDFDSNWQIFCDWTNPTYYSRSRILQAISVEN